MIRITLTGHRARQPWVAELTGTHPKYRFARQFLRAVAVTGRSPYQEYIYELEEDKIYQTSKTYSWGNQDVREILTVCDDGIKTIKEIEARDLLINKKVKK
ncbi:MAG: hypothetical protein AB1765_12875 [Candidatus Hydrogenedentota bacterium]